MSDSLLSALADRVSRLEDERAVTATINAFSTAVDYGDLELMLDTFTPEAEYIVDLRVAADRGFRCRGRDEIQVWFANHTHAPEVWHKHLIGNVSVTFSDDTARATSYLLRVDAVPDGDGPAVVRTAGRCTDELIRRDDGKWRIQSRRIEIENR